MDDNIAYYMFFYDICYNIKHTVSEPEDEDTDDKAEEEEAEEDDRHEGDELNIDDLPHDVRYCDLLTTHGQL